MALPTSRPLKRCMRVALAIAIGFTLILACGDELSQEELDCEEAVAYLEDCCPGFSGSRLSCAYGAGCSSAGPAIHSDESQCLRAQSCSTLLKRGVCQRFEPATSSLPADAQAEGPSPELCP